MIIHITASINGSKTYVYSFSVNLAKQHLSNLITLIKSIKFVIIYLVIQQIIQRGILSEYEWKNKTVERFKGRMGIIDVTKDEDMESVKKSNSNVWK